MSVDEGFIAHEGVQRLGFTFMTDDEVHRAPIKCSNCGAIVPARIKPDGSVIPIGQKNACDCDEADFRIVDKDDPAADE